MAWDQQRHKMFPCKEPTTPAYHRQPRHLPRRAMQSQLCPFLSCPVCRKIGRLTIGLDEEVSYGITGILCFVCSNCDQVTLRLHTSEYAPIKRVNDKGTNAGGRKPAELNLRATLAAAMCGMGDSGLEKLCGVMGMPALSHTQLKPFRRS